MKAVCSILFPKTARKTLCVSGSELEGLVGGRLPLMDDAQRVLASALSKNDLSSALAAVDALRALLLGAKQASENESASNYESTYESPSDERGASAWLVYVL